MGEETILLCKKIPNNLRSFSTLKEMGYNSPLLTRELHIVTSSQRRQHRSRERGSDLTVKKPDKHYLIWVTKVNSDSDKSY